MRRRTSPARSLGQTKGDVSPSRTNGPRPKLPSPTIPGVAGTLSVQDLASESGTSVELIDRLVGIGALEPTASYGFRAGDVVRV
jgi:hypothetical protein